MNRGFFSDVFFLLMVLIRPATVHDVPLLWTLIRELAAFEHELELCVIEEATLLQDGFGASPCFHALIADWDGQPAGTLSFLAPTRPGRGGDCFWRICLCESRFAAEGLGRRC
jgi:hypothetical protein